MLTPEIRINTANFRREDTGQRKRPKMSRRYLKRVVYFIVLGTASALLYFVYSTARMHAGTGWTGGVENMRIQDKMEDNLHDDIQDNVRDSIPDNIKNKVKGNLKEDIRDNIGGIMKDNLQGDLRDNVRDNIQGNIENNIRGNIKDNIRGNMEHNLQDDLRDNVRDNIQGNVENNIRYNSKNNIRENEDKNRQPEGNPNVHAADDGNRGPESVGNNANGRAAGHQDRVIEEAGSTAANLKEPEQAVENRRSDAGNSENDINASSTQETDEHPENRTRPTLPPELIYKNDKGEIIGFKLLPYGLPEYLKNRNKSEENINQNNFQLGRPAKNNPGNKETKDKQDELKTFDMFLAEQHQQEKIAKNAGAFHGRFGHLGIDNNAQKNNIIDGNRDNVQLGRPPLNNVDDAKPNYKAATLKPFDTFLAEQRRRENVVPNAGAFQEGFGQLGIENNVQHNLLPNNLKNNLFLNRGQNVIPNNGQNNVVPGNAENKFLPNNGQNNVVPGNAENKFLPNNGQNNVVPGNAENIFVPNNGQNNFIPNNAHNNGIPNNEAGALRDNIEVKEADLLNKNVGDNEDILRKINAFAPGNLNKQQDRNPLQGANDKAAQEKANPFGRINDVLQDANQPVPVVNNNAWKNGIINKNVPPLANGREAVLGGPGAIGPAFGKANQQEADVDLQQQQQQQQAGFAEQGAADPNNKQEPQPLEDVNTRGKAPIKCLDFRFPTGLGKLCIPGGDNAAGAMAKIQQDISNAAEVVNQVVLILSSDKSLSFIDVGAGIGAFSTAAALLVRGVFALEPLKVNHQLLLQTASENHVSHRIKLLERALDSDSYVGLAKPAAAPESYGEAQVARLYATNVTDDSNTVQVTTLNNVVSDVPFRRALLRLGFQGGISDSFLDTSSTFFRELDIPYIITHWPGSKKAGLAAKIASILGQLGYTPSLTWNGLPMTLLIAMKTDSKHLVWRKVRG